jgi:VanZ family protein
MGTVLRKTAWILALLCMAFIFFMSSRPVERSRQDSEWLISLIGMSDRVEDGTKINDDGQVILSGFHIMIRKYAHLILFGTLGALFFASVYGYFGREMISGGISLLLVGISGAIDETIQIFSKRGAAVSDVFLDLTGGLCGIVIMGTIFLIITRVKPVKKFFGHVYNFEPARSFSSRRL